jgi:translation initiation factor IF-1
VGADKAVESGAGGRKTGARGRGPGARVVVATVVEERPSAIYVVVLEKQQRVLAHVVGAVKRNFVRLVPGDRVEVELGPHDPTRGRITRKLPGE